MVSIHFSPSVMLNLRLHSKKFFEVNGMPLTYQLILAVIVTEGAAGPQMEAAAQQILWITSLALPMLVFLAFEPRRRIYRVLVAGAGIASGWLFNLALAVVSQSIAAHDASEVNGAVLAFSAVFGWVIPSVLVALAWGGRRLLIRRKST